MKPNNQGKVMNGRLLKSGLAALAFATLGAGSLLAGDDGDREHGRDRDGKFVVRAELIGYQEVPALSTTAHGRFRAVVDTVANTITWKLSYDGLEGNVTQAHVHFGQMGVNGGISFYLCSNLANPPAGTQACPVPPAEITGVITPDQVIGPGPVVGPPATAGQGIEPGAFSEIAAAIKESIAYANVHTSKWPGGEIRGQLR
jgi:hypothetical protein